jgi:hypothetical protein
LKTAAAKNIKTRWLRVEMLRKFDDIAFGNEVSGSPSTMLLFFSNRLGCLGSILISIVGTLVLLLILKGCQVGI